MDSLNEQFGRIYDQYIDKIYRFIYLKVNSQEVAQDITSKVFTRGWEAYQERAERIENPGAFLYQVARNAVVDFYREKGRNRIISAEDSPELVSPGTDAQDKAILSADINTIKKALQKLNKEHQDIIIWHYLDDMPISEVAKLVGRPEGTVRVMLHRALGDLRGIIQES